MKNNKIEASVILSICCKTKKLYGIRVEKKSDGLWHFTWAFKINEDIAKREGYDSTRIPGNYVEDKTYKGCPYCGSDSWLLCIDCGHLSCQENDKQYGSVCECQWCGKQGIFSPLGDEYEFKGGEM